MNINAIQRISLQFEIQTGLNLEATAMITNNDNWATRYRRHLHELAERGLMNTTDNTGFEHWYTPPATIDDDANKPDLTVTPNADQQVRVRVNKTTHRIDFNDETEHEVTVVVAPKAPA